MKISLVGFGNSTSSLLRRICKQHEIFISERRKLKDSELRLAESCGAKVEESHSERILDSDLIVMSPGISPFTKVGEMVEKSGKFNSDIGVFFDLIKPNYRKLVAVTGTNGKTTTTMMINHFLKESGYRTCLCGNNETPVSMLKEEVDYIVLEISSFQLYWTQNLDVDFGLLLNISPDHLDWHRSFEHYLRSKLKLEKFSNVIFFGESLDREPKFSIIDESLIPKHLKKRQDIENISGAAALLKAMGFNERDFFESLRSFKLPSHRLEFVGEINGIKFYNDSKATNTHATLKALENFEKVTLILSGILKENDLDRFLKVVSEKSEAVILLGDEIQKRIKSIPTVMYRASNMDEAVKKALELSSGVVLFSPAGASFDMYENYKERGDDFKRAFLELVKDGI